MTDDLIEFLRARLDEDEQAALAATPGPWSVDSETYAETIYGANHVDVVAGGRWGGEASVFESTADAVHIARHNPARVLAEVAARRGIIQLCERSQALLDASAPGDRGVFVHGAAWLGRSDSLRLLAEVYSDHPDFRAEWKLSGPQ